MPRTEVSRSLWVLSIAALVAVFLLAAGAASAAVLDPPGQWYDRAPSGSERQEVSYVEAGGKFYLAGGFVPRSGRTDLHERYNPQTDSWERVAPLPAELDHIQGVELGGKIYYVGGLSGPKTHVNTVYIYDPATDSFDRGTPMPSRPWPGRRRGGRLQGQDLITPAGNTTGRPSPGSIATIRPPSKWTRLPNMPRAREHFQGAVVGDKFFAIGGRDTTIDATFPGGRLRSLSFRRWIWRTRDTALPTARAGFATAVLGRRILVVGGEGGGNVYDTVEAYYPVTTAGAHCSPCRPRVTVY